MIKFALICAHGHEFQSWFQSSEAFDVQVKDGLVLCPLCQATEVTKAIMAPAIASRSAAKRAKPPAQPQPQAQTKVALLDQRDLETRAMINAFRKRLFEQAEDVGTSFAEEARKISRRPRSRAPDLRPGECRRRAGLARRGRSGHAGSAFARGM